MDLGVATLYLTIPNSVGADYSKNEGYARQTNIFDDKLYESAAKSWVVFSQLWGFKGRFWQGYVGELSAQVLVHKKIKDSQTIENLYPLADSREVVSINGIEWNKYVEGDGVYYAISLTNDHFLAVRFLFIDDSSGKNTEWRKRAQKYVDNVVRTLKVTR